MAVLPVNTDYTDKDFDALRARMRNLISSVFPDWTDDNAANFGNILIESFCFIGDVLGKYQDGQARESRWSQAKLRKNLIALAKLINFVPTNATAAQATETFTLSAPVAVGATLTIPKASKVSTLTTTNPTRYQLLADLVFTAGQTSLTATVENSEFQEDVFASTGFSNQEFLLSKTPFVDASASVVAGNGTYTRVDTLLNSSSTDRHFVVLVDQSDRARVRFGNGVNGVIPAGNITVSYKTGGGKAGRVEANTLKKLEGTYRDSLGNAYTVTVNNAAASSGGDDRQTNAQIRALAPESLRVLERTVAREDYEIEAKAVAGIGRALMLTSNQDASVAENEGALYVVPTTGGTATQAQLDAVAARFVEKPYAPSFRLSIFSGLYLSVNVTAVVYLAKGTTEATAKAAVTAALTAWFAPMASDGTPNPNVDFGFYYKNAAGNPDGVLPWSDIFNAVRDTAGIRKVGAGAADFLLNGSRADLAISTKEFPKLGTVTLVNGDTGITM